MDYFRPMCLDWFCGLGTGISAVGLLVIISNRPLAFEDGLILFTVGLIIHVGFMIYMRYKG